MILVFTTMPGSISPHRRPKPQKKGRSLKKNVKSFRKRYGASKKGRGLKKNVEV